MKTIDKEIVLQAYLEAMLWVNEEMDELTISDVDETLVEFSKVEIEKFINIIELTKGAVREANTYSDEQLGHNFLLSRNGHGAGFFDNGNDILQDICKKFGSVDVYIGDDNKIYF